MAGTRRRRTNRRKLTRSCGKLRYHDKVAALLALASTAHTDSPSRPKLEKRAYPCPHCGGWHLTSRA